MCVHVHGIFPIEQKTNETKVE